MLQSLSKLLSLLSRRARGQALVLLALMVVLGLVEAAGIASVFPLLLVFGNPASVHENAYLRQAFELLGFQSTNGFFIFLALTMFLMTVLRIVLSITMTYASSRFASMRGHELKVRVLQTYLARPYAWHLQHHSAKLGKTVSSEVEGMVTSLVVPTIAVLQQGIIATFILALMILSTHSLVLLVFATLAACYAAVYLFIRKLLARLGQDRLRYGREIFKITQESLGGVKDIKACGIETTYIRRFEASSLQLAARKWALQVYRAVPRYVMELITIGGMLLALLSFLIRDDGSLGSALPILGFYAYAGLRLLPMIESIYAGVVTLQFEKASLDAIHADLVDAPPVALLGPRGESPFSVDGPISLDHVSFTYPKAEQESLQDVTVRIAPSTLVAIVGATGSGKSTLVDIILGLLEPQQGWMTIGGKVAEGDDLAHWRRLVGYVPQSIFMADETLAANIALGVPTDKIDMAAVERATRVAQLHDFILTLPKGYETTIGDRGVRLSGGQRQRIGIARALYRDPPVLVLDEATSALDNLTEASVLKELAAASPRKTVIMVTHRLTSVRACDDIWFMDSGRMVAHGPYDEMIAREPRFRTLVEKGETEPEPASSPA